VVAFVLEPPRNDDVAPRRVDPRSFRGMKGLLLPLHRARSPAVTPQSVRTRINSLSLKPLNSRPAPARPRLKSKILFSPSRHPALSTGI